MSMEDGKLPVVDLGVMGYRAAWERQLEVHARVLSGEWAEGAMILVEHPAVITIGRHPESAKNLLATKEMLELRGVEVVETDRGGDITFHGPGQLVAYPIIPLNRYNLNLHTYMRLMEEAVIQTIAVWGVVGQRENGATGVWVGGEGEGSGVGGQGSETGARAKVCAMGIKLRKWVTLHGLALNVTTDLGYFELINPCGLGRPVTSLAKLLGERVPAMGEVKGRLVERYGALLGNG